MGYQFFCCAIAADDQVCLTQPGQGDRVEGEGAVGEDDGFH